MNSPVSGGRLPVSFLLAIGSEAGKDDNFEALFQGFSLAIRAAPGNRLDFESDSSISGGLSRVIGDEPLSESAYKGIFPVPVSCCSRLGFDEPLVIFPGFHCYVPRPSGLSEPCLRSHF